jgi:hypothetical protein
MSFGVRDVLKSFTTWTQMFKPMMLEVLVVAGLEQLLSARDVECSSKVG